MYRVWTGLLGLMAAGLALPCRSQQSAASTGVAELPRGDRAARMHVDSWVSLAPPPNGAAIGGPQSLIDTRPAPTRAPGITVYARTQRLDDDWRADSRSGSPAAEPGQSDAAQWGISGVRQPPAWTSADQQRLMSIKTDALGLCGALSGYVQCPNKPP